MVKLSSNRIAWKYTSDDGMVYRVAAQKALTDQAKLGGSAAAGTEPPKPASIKMRRITISNTAGLSRVVPVYSPDAAILVAGTAMNVNVLDDQHSLTSDGNPIPEQRPRRSVTKQVA